MTASAARTPRAEQSTPKPPAPGATTHHEGSGRPREVERKRNRTRWRSQDTADIHGAAAGSAADSRSERSERDRREHRAPATETAGTHSRHQPTTLERRAALGAQRRARAKEQEHAHTTSGGRGAGVRPPFERLPQIVLRNEVEQNKQNRLCAAQRSKAR